MDDTRHTARDDGLGLFGRGDFIGMHPRILLTDGDQFAQIRVQTGAFAGIAEGLFVQVRGAGRNNNTGKFLLFDILLDEFLAQAGAHEFVITCDYHALLLKFVTRPCANLSHVHNTCNVGTTMANVYSDLFSLFHTFHSLVIS